MPTYWEKAKTTKKKAVVKKEVRESVRLYVIEKMRTDKKIIHVILKITMVGIPIPKTLNRAELR